MHDRRRLFVMGSIFGIGLIEDVLYKKSWVMVSIPEYADLCLTVLSVQATVGTLVFTILSLLTGKMGQSVEYLKLTFY